MKKKLGQGVVDLKHAVEKVKTSGLQRRMSAIYPQVDWNSPEPAPSPLNRDRCMEKAKVEICRRRRSCSYRADRAIKHLDFESRDIHYRVKLSTRTEV